MSTHLKIYSVCIAIAILIVIIFAIVLIIIKPKKDGKDSNINNGTNGTTSELTENNESNDNTNDKTNDMPNNNPNNNPNINPNYIPNDSNGSANEYRPENNGYNNIPPDYNIPPQDGGEGWHVVTNHKYVRYTRKPSLGEGSGGGIGGDSGGEYGDVAPVDTPQVAHKEFNTECLSKHNMYRRKHGVKDLKIDKTLINYAKNRALYLRKTDVFAHEQEPKYGENLHYILPHTSYPCDKIVKAWYDEIKDYNYQNPTNSKGMIGHFTQVVWKGTGRVGCAQAYSHNSKKLYTVCTYDPPGNYVGEDKENVLKPMK